MIRLPIRQSDDLGEPDGQLFEVLQCRWDRRARV